MSVFRMWYWNVFDDNSKYSFVGVSMCNFRLVVVEVENSHVPNKFVVKFDVYEFSA